MSMFVLIFEVLQSLNRRRFSFFAKILLRPPNVETILRRDWRQLILVRMAKESREIFQQLRFFRRFASEVRQNFHKISLNLHKRIHKEVHSNPFRIFRVTKSPTLKKNLTQKFSLIIIDSIKKRQHFFFNLQIFLLDGCKNYNFLTEYFIYSAFPHKNLQKMHHYFPKIFIRIIQKKERDQHKKTS